MLEIRNLTKVYDDGTVALKNVSFEVADEEFLIIIGLSGSGKSTLLRCINRLIEPTEGEIMWDWVNVTVAEAEELRAIRRQIGMIFQQFNLVKRSSVLNNVLSGRLGYMNPWSSLLYRFSAEDLERAHEALERVGIPEQAHKRADELSGGQQQRVGIARALMQEPQIILADEPVASLDPVLAVSILGHLQQLNQEDGISNPHRLGAIDLFELGVCHAPNLLPCSAINDLTVPQPDHPRGVDLDQVQVVQAAQDRDAVLLVQLLQVTQD